MPLKPMLIAAAAALTLQAQAFAQAPYGEKPEVQSTAEPREPRQIEQKPLPAQPQRAESQPERILEIEKSTKPMPCVIKPVMTDDELRACGARIPPRD